MMELREYMRGAMAETARLKENPALDSVEDASGNAASVYMGHSLRLHAASVLNQWAETTDEDLDADETLADRLLALLMASVDENGDDELDETEQEMLEAVFSATEEYLLSLDVAPEDVSDLLDNWTDEAAVRVRDALAAALPDGEGADDLLAKFAFDAEAAASVFDSVYRKVVTFQDGKRVVQRKRISGPPKKMSQKQKIAFAMIRRKAHTAAADLAREKSIKKRLKAGIGMKRKLA